jgi:hypothetical protein
LKLKCDEPLSNFVFNFNLRRYTKELGMTSIIIDKRDHIGGNVYDYVTGKGKLLRTSTQLSFDSAPPPPRICVSRHPEGMSCSDIGSSAILNDPPARDGIRASKYGAHLFHTQHEVGWSTFLPRHTYL